MCESVLVGVRVDDEGLQLGGELLEGRSHGDLYSLETRPELNNEGGKVEESVCESVCRGQSG